MIFKLNKDFENHLTKLFDRRNSNDFIAEEINYFMREQIAYLNKKTMQKPYNFIDMYKLVHNIHGLDKSFEQYKNAYKMDDTLPVEEDLILENPYFKNIRCFKAIKGNITLRTSMYLPYQVFNKDEITIDEQKYFTEVIQLGYFTQQMQYLELLENDVNWMSITPHEILTMKDDISKISGSICVVGLGLGYFAYMTSLKDDVESITIIESNATIINVFKDHILPSFENKHKIKIVQSDAFKFLESNCDFDCVYIDIYRDVYDALLPYIRCKKIENKYSVKFYYWIETSIISAIRRILINLIEEVRFGYGEEHYQCNETSYDKIINSMYLYFKGREFERYDQIKEILRPESIKKMCTELNLDF